MQVPITERSRVRRSGRPPSGRAANIPKMKAAIKAEKRALAVSCRVMGKALRFPGYRDPGVVRKSQISLKRF